MQKQTHKTMVLFKQYFTLGVQAFAIYLLTGCATTEVTEETDQQPIQAPSEFAPPPVIQESVNVTSVRVLKLESAPIRAFAYVTGTLPSSDSVINKPSQQLLAKTIEITLTSTRPNSSAQNSTPTPFEERIPLKIEGLRAGNYYVTVNGAESTLTLTRDNKVATPPESPISPTTLPLSPPFSETPN